MAIEYTRVSDQKELEEILLLQRKNLPIHLTDKEIEQEGFVTISHTFDLLDRMNTVCPHIIAKDRGKVIGYALCMHPDFSKEIPIVIAMFQQIGKILPEEQSFIVMGQICIEKSYRGKGIFRGLYKTMNESLSSSFDIILTEVDGTNLRSLNAHYAVGFKDLLDYPASGHLWHLISLKIK